MLFKKHEGYVESLVSLSRQNITSNAMKKSIEGAKLDRELFKKFEEVLYYYKK